MYYLLEIIPGGAAIKTPDMTMSPAEPKQMSVVEKYRKSGYGENVGKFR